MSKVNKSNHQLNGGYMGQTVANTYNNLSINEEISIEMCNVFPLYKSYNLSHTYFLDITTKNKGDMFLIFILFSLYKQPYSESTLMKAKIMDF